MRVVSYNVNGIRAAMNKGFCEWLKTEPADVICLQETRTEKDSVDHGQFSDCGYWHYWFSAKRRAYSGVAVLTKIKPDRVEYGIGNAASDNEGRILQLDFGNVHLINAYFPSGSSGDVRQQFKYNWLNEFYKFLHDVKKHYPNIILAGDYNIAHKEIDIYNPKGNKNTSGFLPAERTWMDKFFDSGWIDTFRRFHPEPHQYSWWSRRFPTVRSQNKGWRLDYINVTESLKYNLTDAKIFADIKHSDHCPVYTDITLQ